MTPRTPEERERLYALLDKTLWPTAPCDWRTQDDATREQWRVRFDALIAICPALWDSLPPDPAEQARKEAEEDGRLVERWRVLAAENNPYSPTAAVVSLVDRMTARAAAGYPVLIAPKGEK